MNMLVERKNIKFRVENLGKMLEIVIFYLKIFNGIIF